MNHAKKELIDMDSKEKRLGIITLGLIVIALIISGIIYIYASNNELSYMPKVMQYESELFGDEIFSVNIIADDATWQSIMDNAMLEEYTPVDVEVNGILYKNVGFRPKGNSTLSRIAQDDSTDRFSFKIKFDEYVTGQTCMGLDLLILNNVMNDSTYLKDYVAYDIMDYIGADSLLYNYANMSLNDENIGLYTALEGYSNSFLLRTYGHANGYLYKVNSNSMDVGEEKTNNRADNSDIIDSTSNIVVSNIPDTELVLVNNMASPQQSNRQQGQEMPQGEAPQMGQEMPQGGIPIMEEIETTTETTTEAIINPKIEMQQGTQANDRQQGQEMQGEMPMMGQEGAQIQGEMPMMGQEGVQMQGEMPQMGQQEGGQMQGEMPQMGQEGAQMQGEMPQMGQQEGGQMQGEMPMMGQEGAQMQGEMSNNRQQGGMMGGMPGGMSMTSGTGGGGDFIYSDDNIDSYADILENSINNTAAYNDKMRVIEAIKALNDGDNYDIEDYWDVDSILRFFAGHTTVVNMDSFSAGRFTNLYVYEFNGKMNLIPWDYNESFAGAFATGVDLVNFPIDTPLINIDMSDFPLLDILLSNPEYQARYHYYLLDICDYIDNTLIAKIEDLQAKINPLIESDPTAFVTYSSYLNASEVFKSALLLRSESVRGQVEGTIPSTTQAQAQNSELLVQHNINASTLGSNSTGGGGGMGGGANGARMQAMGGNMGGDMQIPDLSQLGIDVEGLGLDKIESMEDLANLPQDTINQLQSAVAGQMQGGGMPNMGGDMMAGGMPGGDMRGNSMASNSLNTQNIIIFAGSLLAMLITGILIKKNKI